MTLRFTPIARRHLNSIAEFINERNPSGAISLAECIRFTAELLTKFPYIGHEGTLPGTREIVVTGTPYVILHRIEIGERDIVVVTGIYHCIQGRQ